MMQSLNIRLLILAHLSGIHTGHERRDAMRTFWNKHIKINRAIQIS